MDQAATPTPTPPEEEAVSDAAFLQGPVPPPAAPDEEPTLPASSPLGDYVRELGQEFQDQEDEGKL